MSGDYVHYIQIPHLEILCWRSSEIGLLLIFLAAHMTVLVRGSWCRELLMGCCFWSFSCRLFSGFRSSQHFPEHPFGLLLVTEFLKESH